MKHSKIASIIPSQIFLLIILNCVQGDDVYYPNFRVDHLLEEYSYLPPLDIIPGKSLITPSTSIGDLQKDLAILNKHFEILTDDEAVLTDWNARCNLSRQYAFLKLLKYKDLNITDPATQSLLKRYLQLGELILPVEDSNKVYDLTMEGIKLARKYAIPFQNEIIREGPITVDSDVKLQTMWKSMSEEAGQKMKLILDKYIKIIDDFAKKYGKVIGCSDALSFWKYYNEYDTVSNNELKKMWSNDMRGPYQKLMNYVRNDYEDLYKNYTNMEGSEQMPAYIFDLIFHTHSMALNEKFHDYTTKTIRKKFENVWILDHTRAQNYNVRTLTEEAAKYYESIGFSKMKKSFWKKSVFENVGHNSSFQLALLRDKDDHETEWALVVRAATTVTGYQKILSVLLEYHKRQLLQAAGRTRMLWDTHYEAFQDAFFKAVMMGATSVRKLASLGFRKKDLPDKDLLDFYKVKAVSLFTSFALTMSAHTWKSDMVEKNIGPKNRLFEYWNGRKKYELVVPMTLSPDVDKHDLFDIYIGENLLDGKYNMNYLVRCILQYQIFARLCEIAGQFNPKRPLDKPLEMCDLSGSDKVAEIIRTIAVTAPLKPWRESFDYIMGKPNSTLSAKEGILFHFAPLFHVIDNKNKKSNKKL